MRIMWHLPQAPWSAPWCTQWLKYAKAPVCQGVLQGTAALSGPGHHSTRGLAVTVAQPCMYYVTSPLANMTCDNV